MRNTFRSKASITIVALMALAFLLGFSLCFIFANRYFQTSKQKQLLNVYDKVCEFYVGSNPAVSIFDDPADRNKEELARICEENAISLLIMRPSGRAAFSYGNSALLTQRLDKMIFEGDSAVSVVKQGNEYTLQMCLNDKNEITYLEIWGYLGNGDGFIARSSYAGVQNSIDLSLGFFGFVCAIVFLIVTTIMFFISRSYTDALMGLAQFAQRVNEGEFDAGYDRSKRNDEIGLLGDNVYELSQKLEKSISELKSSNLNLENELKAKIAQEEARKKYMSDVSHELKTPIALISGYAEGLSEGISDDPEDQKYYLSVIIEEAEKMNLMVKRLATLNLLEQGSSEVNLEWFNIVEVIDGFLNTMSIVFHDRQVNVYFNNKETVYVWTDEFLFEEVLMNYLNNALNHLDERKIIRINVEKKDDGNVRVTVFNSGENIPEEELDKLWGKFYKVDKARTREYGGSGLGLSIVKAIADSLGRECGVYNQEDGVAFWIDLENANVEKPAHLRDKTEKIGKGGLKDLPIWRSAIRPALKIKRKNGGNK